MDKKENIGKKNRLMQYGVLIVALIMIVSSGVYATIYLSKPYGSTAGSWNGGIGNYITNSAGNTYTFTDDNIRQAIWDLNGTGGTVWLPSGEIFVDFEIKIEQDNICIIGMGGSTILKVSDTLEALYGDPESVSIFEVEIWQQNCSFEKIKFVGLGYGTSAYAIHLFYAGYCIVESCYFTNFGSVCVDPSNGYNNIITNNVFTDSYRGVGLTGTTHNYGNIVSNNVFRNLSEYGIRAGTCYETSITGNVINGDRGILIEGSYNEIGGNIIDGNTIKAQSYGILLSDTDDGWGNHANTIISNNLIDCVTKEALIVSGKNITIDGNYIKSHYDRICTVQSALTNNIIFSNNIISGNNSGSWGIVFEHNPGLISINNNMFVDIKNSGINCGNSNVMNASFQNNYFYNTGDAFDFNTGDYAFISNNFVADGTDMFDVEPGSNSTIMNNIGGLSYNNRFVYPTSEPSNYIAGDAWFNTTTGELGIYDGSGWNWK